MAYAILGTAKPAFFDSSGAPLASGTLTVQDPDDSSAKDTYPTANDADASTNGVSTAYTLDSRGEIATQLWGRDGEDYKVILKDSSGSTVYTIDEIRLPPKSRRAIVSFDNADATPSIAEGTHFLTTGSTTITDFDDGQVGDIIHIQAQSTITVQHLSNTVALANGLDFAMLPSDRLVLAMFEDQVWSEIGRAYGNGTLTETVTTTNVITEGENGRTYFLNAAGGFTSTLPAPADGLNYKFIVTTAPTTAYIITTNSGDNVIYGNLLDIVGEMVAVVAQDTVNFVASTSLIGDTAEFFSDGTNWYCKLRSGANGGITTAAS